MKKNIKKIVVTFALLVFSLLVYHYDVLALVTYGNPDDDYCFTFDIDPMGFPVSSVTINGDEWTNDPGGYVFYNDKLEYTIVIKAGKNADDEFPEISTPGGYSDYGSYDAVPNTEQDPNVEGDEYIFTLVLNSNMTKEAESQCYGLGLSIHGGPEPMINNGMSNADINISINGDTLEYHYVEDKPDEADVTRISFSINGGQIVPFTFGNANYHYNNNPAPNNVSSVNTKNAIPYEYDYDNTGTVTFHFHAASAEEITKLQINGEDYTDQAPHTFDEIYEHIQGRASHFDVTGVEYNPGGYDIHIEGERLPAEKQVGSFGWNYKKESEPDYDPNEDSLMTHGSLEFVSVEYDGILYDSVSAYNSAKYHGTGEVFEWHDGDRNYTDIRDAWGEALVPYGATLTIRIIPDAGYQLVSLTNSQTGFVALDEVGVYRIEFNSTNMGNGADNFHLGAHFTEIDNEINTPATNVNAANIELNPSGDSALDKGTMKFEVEDVVSMSPTRVESFEGKAETEGYEIDSYLEMSLYNTVYKGGQTDNDNNMLSWDTEVSSLTNNATVMLEYNNNLEGKEVALIHETHDGNDITGYELIEANYNDQTGVISFETNGFSSYAVVYKTDNNTTDPNDPQDPGNSDNVQVTFVTDCDIEIGPISVNKNDPVERPNDPEKHGFRFLGWFTEDNQEYTFTDPVGDSDLTLYAHWEEIDESTLETYDVPDELGNIITFKDEANHSFHLNSMELMNITEAELAALNATQEEYEQVKAMLLEATKNQGDLILAYEFILEDENHNEISEPLVGNFTIKIKITPEMEGYNTFKLVYIKDDFTAGEVIELTEQDGFLVGTLTHLSIYTLNASNTTSSTTNNPNTADSIMIYTVALLVSVITLLVSVKYLKKLN